MKRTTTASAMGSLGFAAVLLAAGNAHAVNYAYVPNQGNNTVSVINTDNPSQTNVLSGIGSSYSATVAPDGSIAYIADYPGSQIFPINTTTNIVGTPIATGMNPLNVTFGANSAVAYVSNFNGNLISVINVATGTVSTTVPNVCMNGAINPAQSVFNGTKLLIVCVRNPSSVVSMDTVNGNALTNFATVGNSGRNIAISTASGFGYVANFGGGNVTKFDLVTGTVTATYTTTGVTNPLGIAVTPDGSKIFIGDYNGNNLIVMSPTGTVLTTLNLGANVAGIGRSTDGSLIYAPLRGLSAGIKVIDTSTSAVVNTIANPGANPGFIYGDFLSNVTATVVPPLAAPTLSEWARIAMAGLLLSSGSWYLMHRRS